MSAGIPVADDQQPSSSKHFEMGMSIFGTPFPCYGSTRGVQEKTACPAVNPTWTIGQMESVSPAEDLDRTFDNYESVSMDIESDSGRHLASTACVLNCGTRESQLVT